MVYIIVLLAAAGVVGFLLGKGSNKGTKPAEIVSPKRLRNTFSRHKKERRAFDQWLNGSTAASQRFKDWYNDLDGSEQQAFVVALKRYLSTFDAKIGWLVDESLQKRAATILFSVEESVIAFYTAYRNANEMRPTIDMLDSYNRWEAQPLVGANRAVTENLHARLLSSGVIENAVPEKGFARTKRAAMLNSIKGYAESEPTAFFEAFESSLSAENDTDIAESNELQSAETQESRRTDIEPAVLQPA